MPFQEPHRYYRSDPIDFTNTWVDLDELNKTQGIVKEHPMLSKSYRRAATITLKFKFPFYGHDVEVIQALIDLQDGRNCNSPLSRMYNVQNITIATGGFLYTGQYVHSWLAATQYIAPLMANFDTSQDDNAKIRYADNGTCGANCMRMSLTHVPHSISKGTSLIVEWINVNLQGKDKNQQNITEGPFTFQAVIHETGDIAFAYKSVPLIITNIEDEEHPVKVGLSDAYIIDRTIFCKLKKIALRRL